jgi:hypothetical protein
MLCKLLCKIGRHEWRIAYLLYYGEAKCAEDTMRVCKRCGKVR